jgi:hypothetical protein
MKQQRDQIVNVRQRDCDCDGSLQVGGAACVEALALLAGQHCMHVTVHPSTSPAALSRLGCTKLCKKMAVGSGKAVPQLACRSVFVATMLREW